MSESKTETALVLQGGGALGAYEVGVAKRLYEQPGFSPTILSGVSIGAINAAVLAQGGPDVIPNLEKMWDQFAVDSFPFVPEPAQRWLPLIGNPNFFQMRYDYASMTSWTSYYSTEPLRRILQERIDFDRINDRADKERPRLVMTATNILAGTNFVHLHAASRDGGREVFVLSAIDNLVKGAAGQAIQAMNLALGLAETAGLEFGGLYPC